MSLVDTKVLKLKALGGVGSISDMFNENTYWRALAGGSTLPINDVKRIVLGTDGSLNDKENAYWLAL
jgi:hypothetical protein